MLLTVPIFKTFDNPPNHKKKKIHLMHKVTNSSVLHVSHLCISPDNAHIHGKIKNKNITYSNQMQSQRGHFCLLDVIKKKILFKKLGLTHNIIRKVNNV